MTDHDLPCMAGGTDLCVGGIFIAPFIATDGFYRFAGATEAANFLGALIEGLRHESRFITEMHSHLGLGLDATSAGVEAMVKEAPKEASTAEQTLTELWHAHQKDGTPTLDPWNPHP